MCKRLDNQAAVVTGGSKGIGRAIAALFAREGAKVLVVYHSDEEAADRTCSEIANAGGTAHPFRADVSRGEDVRRMAEEAVRLFGRIDVLCCSAGTFWPAKIEAMSEAEWDAMQAVNLKGAFLSVQACLPAMQAQRRGRIVLISSITGPRTGFSGYTHYGAAKAGLIGFVRSACLEVARHHITVNAVEPGYTLTDGLKGLMSEAVLAEITAGIPLKRMADPDDVACAALFLASDEARHITGQSIVVDGGQTLPEVSARLTARWEQNSTAP